MINKSKDYVLIENSFTTIERTLPKYNYSDKHYNELIKIFDQAFLEDKDTIIESKVDDVTLILTYNEIVDAIEMVMLHPELKIDFYNLSCEGDDWMNRRVSSVDIVRKLRKCKLDKLNGKSYDFLNFRKRLDRASKAFVFNELKIKI